MMADYTCKKLCDQIVPAVDMRTLADFIRNDYHAHWVLDNLPAATIKPSSEKDSGEVYYNIGFPVGFKGSFKIPGTEEKAVYLNNHIDMEIMYHFPTAGDESRAQIVGFEVHPQSRGHSLPMDDSKISESQVCGDFGTLGFQKVAPQATRLAFTYKVKWTNRPDLAWSSRWDTYLKVPDTSIHWFAIINSLMIVFFLSLMVAMILIRALRADISKYAELAESEDAEEERGWKLVHGDVFRPPSHPLWLTVLSAAGFQVTAMTVFTVVFAVLGFLSPANRGGLLSAILLFYAFMGIVAGYQGSRFYKLFGGKDWKAATILIGTFVPGTIFGIFFILNIFFWAKQSSAAVPFFTMLVLLLTWFGISVPLVGVGSYFGFKKETMEVPGELGHFPKIIPEQVWYLRPWPAILMGGVLPFGAVFIELFFILSSVWNQQIYYMFGFLFLVLVILFVTAAEITIVMTYFQLCAEDWRWWWRAFLTPGASAIHLFLYMIFYFNTKLTITGFVPAVLYFGYTTIIAILFFLLTGTVGFYSTWWFVVKIYGSIKTD